MRAFAGGLMALALLASNGAAVRNHDIVLIGTVGGEVLCLDANTGARRWSLDTGGPLVAKTGPAHLIPPFIPSLTKDAELFRMEQNPRRLQRMNVSLYSLLQPIHSEDADHLLLTSKQTRLFEVDCDTGDLVESATAPFRGRVVQILRHDVTIKEARKWGWSYTASNLFIMQRKQQRSGDVPKICDKGPQGCNRTFPLDFLDTAVEVLVSSHDQLAVGVHQGTVVWQHPIETRPVVVYSLGHHGFAQKQLLLYPLHRSSEVVQDQLPALLLDSFDGIQYALVNDVDRLPQQLVPLSMGNRPLLTSKGEEKAVWSWALSGSFPVQFAEWNGTCELPSPPPCPLLQYFPSKSGQRSSKPAAGWEIQRSPGAKDTLRPWNFSTVLLAVAPVFVAASVDFGALTWSQAVLVVLGLGLLFVLVVLVQTCFVNFQWVKLLLNEKKVMEVTTHLLKDQVSTQSQENMKLKSELERQQQQLEEQRQQLEKQRQQLEEQERMRFDTDAATDRQSSTLKTTSWERNGSQQTLSQISSGGSEKMQRSPRRSKPNNPKDDDSSWGSFSSITPSEPKPYSSSFFARQDELSVDDDDDISDEGGQRVRPPSLYKMNYTELRLIATGGFGKVFLVRSNTDDKEYALKKVFMHGVSAEELERRRGEAVLCSKFDHQNVVRYYTSWVEETEDPELEPTPSCEVSESLTRSSSWCSDGPQQQLFILMEYYQCGTLSDLFTKWCESQAPIKLADIHSIFKQLIKGISYLHRLSVLHRDLKPSNVFIANENLQQEGTLKIGDFGLSWNGQSGTNQFEDNGLRLRSLSLTTGIGSPLYAAPEQFAMEFERNSYDQKADIFSLGMIFFECFIRPKTSSERQHLLGALRDKNQVPPWLEQHYPMEMALIRGMTKLDPCRRLSLDDIRERVRALRKAADQHSDHRRKVRSPNFRPAKPSSPVPPSATLPLGRSRTPSSQAGELPHLGDCPDPSLPNPRPKRSTKSLGQKLLRLDTPPGSARHGDNGLLVMEEQSVGDTVDGVWGGSFDSMCSATTSDSVVQPCYSMASDTTYGSAHATSQDPVSPVLMAKA